MKNLKELLGETEKQIFDLLQQDQINNPQLAEEYQGTTLSKSYNSSQTSFYINSFNEKQRGEVDPYTIRLVIRAEENAIILSQIYLFITEKGTGTKICNLLIAVAKKQNLKQFRIHTVETKGSKALCKKLKMKKEAGTNNYYLDL